MFFNISHKFTEIIYKNELNLIMLPAVRDFMYRKYTSFVAQRTLSVYYLNNMFILVILTMVCDCFSKLRTKRILEILPEMIYALQTRRKV